MELSKNKSMLSLQDLISHLSGTDDVSRHQLFGANKLEDPTAPEKQGVRIDLANSLSGSVNRGEKSTQDLCAVLSLGDHIAVGVVRVDNLEGTDGKYYLSLLNNTGENNGRAWIISPLSDDTPITLTRGMVEETADIAGAAPGVSRKHCTVEVHDNILTVVDENSTNGTTVLSCATYDHTNTEAGHNPTQLPIAQWSARTKEAKMAIDRQDQPSKLGRFTIDS